MERYIHIFTATNSIDIESIETNEDGLNSDILDNKNDAMKYLFDHWFSKSDESGCRCIKGVLNEYRGTLCIGGAARVEDWSNAMIRWQEEAAMQKCADLKYRSEKSQIQNYYNAIQRGGI